MKKKIVISLICLLFITTACSNNDKRSNIKTNKIDESNYKTTGYDYINCAVNAQTEDNSKATIKYEVYYDKEKNLQVLKSLEQVESTDKSVLNNYETSYNQIADMFNGLDYYDIVVTKTKSKVKKVTNINYGKIDMDKLRNIEGEDDNVKLTNGKIKLSDWKTFVKKYGVSCSN